MECITIASFSMLVNDIPGDLFRPERGIKQCDHLSLYICIICAEYLGSYIKFMTNTPKTGISIKKLQKMAAPQFLILCLSMIVWFPVKLTGRRHVNSVLDNYCKVSGQLVNMLKFSKGLEIREKHGILDILQVLSTNSIGRYLGYRNIDYRRTRSDFRKIQERICSKLERWKARTLSRTGKVVLIK